MSIQEAEYILNEAVIEHPSITSYTYISSEEINQAINKILEERLEYEKKIKELEEVIIKERNRYKEVIIEKELERNKKDILIYKNKKTYLKNIVKYVKKVVKPLFLLEN